MQRMVKHKIQRTNYKSPVIAVVISKSKTNKQAITTQPKSRARKKRFGIFTKKEE